MSDVGTEHLILGTRTARVQFRHAYKNCDGAGHDHGLPSRKVRLLLKEPTHTKRMKNGHEEENAFVSGTDPEGSYTGNPTIVDEPEQDADDL